MAHEWHRGEHTISTDPARLDIGVIHRFLSTESYWARGRSVEKVQRSIEHSLPFGLYRSERQVGFARVVTDRTTFAWIADVFVLDSERGRGLAKWLVKVILAHPELQNLRRWILATRDAHELYRKYGFTEFKHPEAFMEIVDSQAQATLDRNAETASD